MTISEILNIASEFVIFQRLLNQNNLKLSETRRHFVGMSGVDLETLSNDFQEKVLKNKEISPLGWIDSKIVKTKIGKLSQSWNKIRLRRDGSAHALLQGHWGEMLFNALKYWDHSQKEFLTISFKEKKAGDYKWLQMVWKNPCSGISNRNSTFV